MGALKANLQKVEIWDRLVLTGSIGEGTEATLRPLLNKIGANCLINMRAVIDANSCGIAEWVEFISACCEERTVVFEECPPSIVNVLNMIPAFRNTAQVYSAYAPYRCTDCGKSQWHLYTASVNMPTEAEVESGNVKADTIVSQVCPCSKPLAPEVNLSEYFEFVIAE